MHSILIFYWFASYFKIHTQTRVRTHKHIFQKVRIVNCCVWNFEFIVEFTRAKNRIWCASVYTQTHTIDDSMLSSNLVVADYLTIHNTIHILMWLFAIGLAREYLILARSDVKFTSYCLPPFAYRHTHTQTHTHVILNEQNALHSPSGFLAQISFAQIRRYE